MADEQIPRKRSGRRRVAAARKRRSISYSLPPDLIRAVRAASTDSASLTAERLLRAGLAAEAVAALGPGATQ